MDSAKITQYINNICNYLWLSATSVGFYKDLHQNHNGWGVGRFFVIYIVVALMFTLSAFCDLHKLENRLQGYIPLIASQAPIINYDGKNIETPTQTPLIIRGGDQQAVAVIDPTENLEVIRSLLSNESGTQLMLFSKSAIKIYNYKAHRTTSVSLPYVFLLGSSPAAINSSNVTYYCESILRYLNKELYFITVAGIVLYFIFLLGANIGGAIIMKIVSFFITPTDFKTAYRMSLTSTCPPMVLGLLLGIVMPNPYNDNITYWFSVIIFIIMIRALRAIRREVREHKEAAELLNSPESQRQ